MIHTHNMTLNSTDSGVYYLRAGTAYYIGMTRRSFAQRWKEHITDLQNNTHANYKLQQAYASGMPIACGVLITLRDFSLIERVEIALIKYYLGKVDLLNLEHVTISHVPEIDHEPEIIISASQSGISSNFTISHASDHEKSRHIRAYFKAEIVKLRNQKYTKAEVIKQLWNVSAGASKKYKAYSRLYDRIME